MLPLLGSVHVEVENFPLPDDVNVTMPEGAEPEPVPVWAIVAVQVVDCPADDEVGEQDTEVVVGCFQETVTDAAAEVELTATPVAVLST